MARFTLRDLAIKVLNEEKEPLSALEIWEIAVSKGYDKKGNFTGKTPWYSIGAIIYVDLRDNKESPFVKVGTKPRRFFLKMLVSEEELRRIQEKESKKVEKPTKLPYTERELHPFLSYYAYAYMKAYTKTIFHERSKRRKYAEWTYPDIVGVYLPVDDWSKGVLQLSKSIGASSIILYSFELKREIGFTNLRESFFQTVSNSSWANESYLVASVIEQDDEFQSELRRLSTSFGIGIMKLDIENPDGTEIVLPAKLKSSVDWETINKIAVENPDFEEFINRVKTDISSNEIRKEKYDAIYNVDTLLKKIARKQAN